MKLNAAEIRVEGSLPLNLIDLYVLPDQDINNIASSVELLIATKLLSNLKNSINFNKYPIGHFLSVASLPRAHPEFLSHNALKNNNLSSPHIVELGNNCATVLDAILSASFITKSNETTVLICPDAFQSTYSSMTSSLSNWKDGGAAIVFGPNPKSQSLSILAYFTTSNPEYVSLSTLSSNDNQTKLTLLFNNDFLKKDLDIELSIVKKAMSAANLGWEDVDGYVTINRNCSRTEKLRNTLSQFGTKLYESREFFGHRGGSDLIMNLKLAVTENINHKSIKLILVGNGLGYTWSAMVVNITQN